MFAEVLHRIDRWNSRHPWSHNDFYHPWLLRHVPTRASACLDIGCGTGNLARTLAEHGHDVTGIDIDARALEQARELSLRHRRVRYRQQSLLDPPHQHYDVVTAVAVVHHLDLAAALHSMERAAAPGGRILIIGCYRGATRFDRIVDIVAVPVNMLMGLSRSKKVVEARRDMSAPTEDPTTTLAEVRAVAERVLPGSRVRRRLFWRYTLSFQR